jgi:hypothetical protein
MLAFGCDGKTSGEVLESDTERLPPWLPPPPGEPPQPDKITMHKDNSEKPRGLNVIYCVIVNQALRPTV